MTATWFFDTSAAAKLMLDEPESRALRRSVDQHHVTLVSSLLLETELRRLAARLGVPLDIVHAVLSRFALVGLPRPAFVAAGMLPGEHLRSLDAIHVAAAMLAGIDDFVTYDDRQAAAALAAGLTVVAPA